jgi:hypothetical protein
VFAPESKPEYKLLTYPAVVMAKNRKRKNVRNKQPLVVIPVGIPRPVQSDPVLNRTIRYVANAAFLGGISITYMSLLRSMFLVSNNPNGNVIKSAFGILSGYRLNWIKIHSCPSGASTSQFNTVSLSWVDVRGPVKTIEATGTSASPAFIQVKPPKQTLIRDFINWLGGSLTVNPFNLIGNQGDIIDVNFSFVLTDGFTNATNQTWLTSAAAGGYGTMYVAALDNTSTSGVWNATPVLLPVEQSTLA